MRATNPATAAQPRCGQPHPRLLEYVVVGLVLAGIAIAAWPVKVKKSDQYFSEIYRAARITGVINMRDHRKLNAVIYDRDGKLKCKGMPCDVVPGDLATVPGPIR